MGSSKRGQTTILMDVENDEEWREVLEKPGLVVVDIYSAWSGPCSAMYSSLKKVKTEMAPGGDLVLSYVAAKSDGITDLERFRGKSEPAWMFLEAGQMVNMVFGANWPKLRKELIFEMRRMQHDEAPKWSLPVTQRGPEEEARWQKEEAAREAVEAAEAAAKAAKSKAKYEAYLVQMMFELSEETALLLFPWVFLDDSGTPVDKNLSVPYSELRNELFLECFDIVEEVAIQLDEKTIRLMFHESDAQLTDHFIQGLTAGKCMVMRLRGRPPHPDWPVKYPNECPKDVPKCPIRAIDDVENYLGQIIQDQPPPIVSSKLVRTSFDNSFVARHVYHHQPDPNIQGDVEMNYPAVWIPPHARSKVHVFKTCFPAYMKRAHPYEEEAAPIPLCAFKFRASNFSTVREACANFPQAIKNFGVFDGDKPYNAKLLASSPHEFENNHVKVENGKEIIVIILLRINEEIFLSFAGIGPYLVLEDEEQVDMIIQEFFDLNLRQLNEPDSVDEQHEGEGEGEMYFEGYGQDEEELDEFLEMLEEVEEFGYGVVERL